VVEATKARIAPFYIPAVIGLGAIALVVGSQDIGSRDIDPVMVLVLAGLAGIAQRLPVFLFKSSAVSVAFAATIASYVLYGTGVALGVNLVSAAVNAFTPRRKPIRKSLFNAGVLTISAYLASTTYQVVGGQVPPGNIVATIAAVAVSGLVYFLANSAIVAGVITLTSHTTFTQVYKENYSWMIVNYLATATNGAALALAYQSLELFGTFTFVLPLGVAWYSFKLYMVKSTEVRRRNDELQTLNEVLESTNTRLAQSHISVIGALVGALDAKDHYTHGHSAATMFHAVALARQLSLSEEEIASVQLAALFHDIGKIGIPEQILCKAGPLTPEEWVEMKRHTLIGEALLSQVPTLDGVRPIVVAHHERWDGKGYPNGLKGDEIPRAAQVITVADSFQAMTSTRSYRKAMSRADAIEELRRCAGTQFNPEVVQAFIELLEEESTSKAKRRAPAHELEHAHVRDQAAEAATRVMH